MNELTDFAGRLGRARRRRYRTAKAAVAALNRFGGIKTRTYYSHEAGDRMPSDADIKRYAELFGVSPEYLRYGTDSDRYEDQPDDINEDESSTSLVPVNQTSRPFDLNSSHNRSVRFIPILSADQIGAFVTGRGDLAQMSGYTLPVPGFLEASGRCFAYLIPANDFSMVTASGLSYSPGTCVVVDLERQIQPGDRVLAELAGFDRPVVRRFVAARAWAPGVPFRLEAFNPAFAPIEVSGRDDCTLIARIIWVGQEQ